MSYEGEEFAKMSLDLLVAVDYDEWKGALRQNKYLIGDQARM